MNLLQIQNLKIYFPIKRGLFGGAKHFIRAVDDVSFSVAPGEAVGLVGESGCGKTSVGRAAVKLIEPTSGRIVFEGEDIASLSEKELRIRRRLFQMIFQDPYGSLDPRQNISDTIGEALDIHCLAPDATVRRLRIDALLKDVGLDPIHAYRFPHEFSGGQRQRIGIARALAVEPKLIICDEPLSALDVCVQAHIVNLLKDLQRERGVAYLFISHDLAVVKHLCQRIVVMYLGRVVETGPAHSVCQAPQHPYTDALLSAVPILSPESKRQRIVLEGDVPSPIDPPAGCPFHPRCPVAKARCRSDQPELRQTTEGWKVACHFPNQVR